MEERARYEIDEDARQWDELGRLKDRFGEHELGCEKRHGELVARISKLEAKIDHNQKMIEQRLDAAASGKRSNRELIAIVVSALAILAALFSGVWA